MTAMKSKYKVDMQPNNDIMAQNSTVLQLNNHIYLHYLHGLRSPVFSSHVNHLHFVGSAHNDIMSTL